MRFSLARLFAVASIVTFASGCIDEARCDAAIEGIARARREAMARDQQIAWLGWQQAQLAAAVVDGGARAAPGAEREALLRRIAALEAENASLMVRLGRAERELAVPRAPQSRRRLDEVVPYDRPIEPPEDDVLVRRGAPRANRTLDESIPYELHAGTPRAASSPVAVPAPRAPSKRTLDESVPY